MAEMCDHVANRWHTDDPLMLSAYVLWRTNWIHPFIDGNGRTSRMASYIVLCLHTESLLPGKNTVPEQIAANGNPYYEALGKADLAWLAGKVDVSELKDLLASLLAKQLLDFHNRACGN